MKYKERTKSGPATPICKTMVYSAPACMIAINHSIKIDMSQFKSLSESDSSILNMLSVQAKEFNVNAIFEHHNAKTKDGACFDVISIIINDICELKILVQISNILANIHWIIIDCANKTIQLNNVFADLKGTLHGKTESGHKTSHK